MDNKMKKIAKLLDLELYQDFNLTDGYGDIYENSPYRLTEYGLIDSLGDIDQYAFTRLLIGEISIYKIPCKPELGQKVYSINANGEIKDYIFSENIGDIALYLMGNVFVSEEEAINNKKFVIEKYKAGIRDLLEDV